MALNTILETIQYFDNILCNKLCTTTNFSTERKSFHQISTMSLASHTLNLENSFDTFLKSVIHSCLNFSTKETPYSLYHTVLLPKSLKIWHTSWALLAAIKYYRSIFLLSLYYHLSLNTDSNLLLIYQSSN